MKNILIFGLAVPILLFGAFLHVSILPVFADKTAELHGTLEFVCGNQDHCKQIGKFPMQNTYYEIYEVGHVYDTFIGSGFTNDIGFFSFTLTKEVGNKFYVEVYDRNDAADVVCPHLALCASSPSSAIPHSGTYFFDFPGVKINQGDKIDYGTQILPDLTGVNSAARVADDLEKAWKFIRTNSTEHVKVPQATVDFPCGVFCPGVSYFDPYVFNTVNMKSDISTNSAIHEYGHYVMYVAFSPDHDPKTGSWPLTFFKGQDNCMTHSFGSECTKDGHNGEGVAWTEGWANFFSIAVLNNSTFDAGSFSVDLEQGTSNTLGPKDEGNVASTLWDLMAPVNATKDHFGVGFMPIFDALWNGGKTDTLRSFYDKFLSMHPESSWSFFEAALNNGIDDYTKPSKFATIKCSPESITIPREGSGNITCIITPLLGFSGEFNLNQQGMPRGIPMSSGFSSDLGPEIFPGEKNVNTTAIISTGDSPTGSSFFNLIGTGTVPSSPFASKTISVSTASNKIMLRVPSPSLTTSLEPTSIPVGKLIHDTAMLNNTTPNAVGFVTYSFQKSENCSGSSILLSKVSVRNGNVPNSDGFAPTINGQYTVKATYSGDIKNKGDSKCESFTAVDPKLSLALYTTSKGKTERISGTGFLPNKHITMMVGVQPVLVVKSDSRGIFNFFYKDLKYPEGAMVTATDGTYTANGTFPKTAAPMNIPKP